MALLHSPPFLVWKFVSLATFVRKQELTEISLRDSTSTRLEFSSTLLHTETSSDFGSELGGVASELCSGMVAGT
jgi:hypothetical protein